MSVHDSLDQTGTYQVVVIGAGPVGLAAAAHLAEHELPFLVLEAGDGPAATVREWGHVPLFSPWRYNIDSAGRRLLEAGGWTSPDPDLLPTGASLVDRYLRPLAELAAVAPHVRYLARVTGISRLGYDRVRSAGREQAPFVVRLDSGEEILARSVVDASGTWTSPNVLGANGLPAHGERAAAAWVDHCLPDVLGTDQHRYANRHTVVVGAGHSAITTLLALAELAEKEPDTRITWAIRAGSPERAYGGGANDELPARGALGTGIQMLVDAGTVSLVADFATAEVRPLGASPDSAGVELVGRGVDGRRTVVTADRIIAATGFRPDLSFATELRLDLDPILQAPRAIAPLVDPNQHSCGTVSPHGVDELTQPEPGYFVVGMKSYGRAPTFLMATGYEQVRSVVAALAGDWTAAREVQLELPETGVCSVTAGAEALAARLGVNADRYGELLAATARHLPRSPSAGQAVLTAAAELGVDRGTALQLAAYASALFDVAPAAASAPTSTPTSPSASGRTELTCLPSGQQSGSCCG